MDHYMDEKWKLNKKGSCSRREHSTTSSSSRREHQHPSTNSGAYLKRCSSMPDTVKSSRRPSSSTSTSTSTSTAPSATATNSGSSPRSFSSRCTNLVKEQRAKFYIMRRCVNMLICWRDYP